jgi:hypothetical protein
MGPIEGTRVDSFTYEGVERDNSIVIPTNLQQNTPASLGTVYTSFLEWISRDRRESAHFGSLMEFMLPFPYLTQLISFRFYIIAQFLLRHPRDQIGQRREWQKISKKISFFK